MSEKPNVKDALKMQWRLMHPVPPFVPGGCLFDRSTYLGRLKHFFSLIDPRNVFVPDSEILAAQAKIRNFQAADKSVKISETDRELWEAQKLVYIGIHPESGNLIPRLGRLAYFMPCNIPIAVGMLTMPSASATVFWQFVNQSYNALFNFANSSSGTAENEKLAVAYALATTGACTIALGLRRMKGFSSAPWLVPYIAVASAGSLNAFFMRREETVSGVKVRDPVSGEIVGQSKMAAKIALAGTILTRSILLPLPLLGLPSVFMKVLSLGWHARRTPALKTAAEVACIAASVGIALPACVAALPQSLEIPVKFLETEFQNSGLKSVVVNRGV